ncbi:unnamed protein product [Cunninghamella echinulata]
MSSSSASAVAASLNNAQPPSASTNNSNANEIPIQLQKQDDIIGEAVDKYIKLSQKIGDVVAEQAIIVTEAIQAQREFIFISTLSQKPDMSSPTFAKLFAPLNKAITDMEAIKDKHRGHPLFNHLSLVGAAGSAFAWFAFAPTPVPHVREMKDSAQFYSNRVIKEFKEKDTLHVEWARAFLNIIEQLAVYVKEVYPTGLTWNPKGDNAEVHIGKKLSSTATTEAPSSSTATPSSTNEANTSNQKTGGAPPPPPPPPPPPVMTFDNEPESKPTGAAAVFAEINRGEGVTAGLRKVDKSQMTHKNPSLRTSSSTSTLGSGKKQAPPTPSKPNKYVLKKPAKTTLEANKWVVENHDGNQQITIEDTAINQAVYIYGCKNSTIQIKGKVNAVTMDSCTKCGLALDSVVSTVDIVNCKSFGLQILHVTPTIAIDKSDGGQIYLSKECLGVEILTAKSSSLNIMVPENSEAENSDFNEIPVPEQIKTTIVDGKLVTTMVEHAS